MRRTILSTNLTASQAAVFYLGQMGFLIRYRGLHFLIDGYVSDYVDRNCCTEEVRWVRRYPAPISPEDLNFVDYVFCTHDHADHTDPYTIRGLLKVNDHARFIAPAPAVKTLLACGVQEDRILSVVTDRRYDLAESVHFTAIPAAHEELHPEDDGGYAEVGYRLCLGALTIVHTGDCCPYEGLEERVRGCDALILPINGRDFYRTVKRDIIGCFDSAEALTLAKNAGAGLLIPAHFDLYEVNGANPAYFVDCQQRINPRQAYHIFMPGERYIFDAPPSDSPEETL